MIDTSTNTVVGTPIPVGLDHPLYQPLAHDDYPREYWGATPLEWVLFRRRRRVQFLTFSAKLEIDLDRAPQERSR